MRKVPIVDATDDELRQFARDNLGLDIHHNLGHENLVSQVGQAWDKPDILLPDIETSIDAETQPGSAPSPTHAGQDGPKPGFTRIYIAITEDAGGKDHVPVGVNGKAMLLPRGKNIDVPHRYIEALSRTVKHVYDALEDGGINPEPRLVARYPYSVLAVGEILADAA